MAVNAKNSRAQGRSNEDIGFCGLEAGGEADLVHALCPSGVETVE
jgi:hypothetical protein